MSWKLLVSGTVIFIIIRKVVGSVLHGTAIVCTIFRLIYRGWMRHLWWEDAWAALALIGDVTCLACIWVNSVLSCDSLGYFLTDWFRAARMSIIFSIIPVANHSGSKIHKWVTSLVVVCFACMWTALLVQKIIICEFHSCRTGKSVGVSLLISYSMILVQFVFGASLLIPVFTIPHSAFLLLDIYNTNTLMFAHIKVAFSLIICKLLVIVAFLYRVYLKDTPATCIQWSLHEYHLDTDRR
ncbi:hypothetical protein BDR07DRAFT_1301790 [Suillus spraguei]|nr:hypothetical protein BDR07DRAFT_1301790 [Suillus spraguei]